MSSRLRGQAAERYAQQWLEGRGMTSVETNYQCRFGEIDLVMRDGAVVVFVEVRMRTQRGYGGAAASVDSRKQRKLRLTAEHYIATRALSARQACRIDVVALHGTDGSWEVEWLANAVTD